MQQQKRFLRHYGYSLLEVLVAVAIVGGVVIVATQFAGMYSPTQATLARTCESHAQSIAGLVASETYYRQVLTYMPLGAARSASTFVPSPGAGSSLVPDAVLWSEPAANYVINTDAGTTQLTGAFVQNFQLIQGIMRDLAALYNSVPAVSCTYGTYIPLTAALPVPTALNRAFGLAPTAGNGITVKVAPFDRTTGADLCGAPPAHIEPIPDNLGTLNMSDGQLGGVPVGTPPALNSPWPAVVAASVPVTPAGTAIASFPAALAGITNVGIELSVLIQYTENGTNQKCSFTQKFEYPPDRTPPPMPTLTVTSNVTSPPTMCGAFSPAQTVTITLSNPAGFEPGSQLMCIDESSMRTWTPNPAPPGPQTAGPTCVDGTGTINTLWHDANGMPPSFPASATPGYPPTGWSFALRPTPGWVPCDKVQQCGVAPVVAYSQAQANVATAPQTLTLSYTVPIGCVLNMASIAIDTAGNRSVPTTWLHSNLNAMTPVEYVSPNYCGAYCPPILTGPTAWNQPAYLAEFPLGYYTCVRGPATPSCCIGLGCTPFN